MGNKNAYSKLKNSYPRTTISSPCVPPPICDQTPKDKGFRLEVELRTQSCSYADALQTTTVLKEVARVSELGYLAVKSRIPIDFLKMTILAGLIQAKQGSKSRAPQPVPCGCMSNF